MKMQKTTTVRSLHFYLLWAFLFLFMAGSMAQDVRPGDPVSPDPHCTAHIKYQQDGSYFYFEDTFYLQTFLPENNITTLWRWDFGDGASATGRYAKHIYQRPGKYEVTLTKAAYITNEDSTAKNSRIKCQAFYYDSLFQTNIYCYQTQLCVQKYSVIVTVENSSTPEECKAIIEYNSRDNYHFKFQDSHFIYTLVPTNVVTYWLWEFGDGNTAKGRYTDHSYAQSGIYEVRLYKVAYDTTHGDVVCQAFYYDSLLNINIPCYYKKVCQEVHSLRIQAGPSPEVNCKAEVAFSNIDKTFYFSDHYRGGQITSSVSTYHGWDFGDGSRPGKGREVKHTYEKPGKYEVTLVKAQYFTDSITAMLCLGFQYDKALDTTIYCFQKEICREEYRFRILVPDTNTVPFNPCKAEISSTVQKKTATLSDDHVIYETAIYRPYPNITSWHWYFGDGKEGNGSKVTHTYASAGNYSATLVKTVFRYDSTLKIACSDDSSLYYNQQLEMFIPCKYVVLCEEKYAHTITIPSDDSDLCGPGLTYKNAGNNLVIFTDTLQQLSKEHLAERVFTYIHYGDGTAGTSLHHQYPGPGSYDGYYIRAVYRYVPTLVACPPVLFDSTLQQDITCGMYLVCKERYKIQVHIPIVCFFGFGYDIKGLNATFYHGAVGPDSNSTCKTTYFWDFGDGSSATGSIVTHSYEHPGTYKVCLTPSNPCVRYIMSPVQCASIVASEDPSKELIIAGISPEPLSESGLFTIRNHEAPYDLVIYDLNGRLVKSFANQAEDVIPLDRSGMESGLYFYHVISKGKTIFRGKMTIR